ncbi:GspH/FimT family pseudopilin [Motilimonas sp. KMU-193]|uniref:GspH/FimT family pseudopilin n=1 Tax=Motilimonas sp. KMU-193 TaxID=3388668 RepID=UPI00396AF14C
MVGRYLGFTLTELLTVVALAGIILMIALPNFTFLSAESRAYASVSSSTRDLLFARNQAVNHLNTVVACPLANGTQCTNQWHMGVDVFIDHNENDALDTGDTILKSASAFHESDTVSFSQTSIRFGADGLTRNLSSSAIIYYCDESETVKKGVIISISGRSKVADNDVVKQCS